MNDRNGDLSRLGRAGRGHPEDRSVTAAERHARFVRLTRLGRDLHGLGVRTSLVLPVAGQPILEIHSTSGTVARITVVRRHRGWAYVWRPWWARLWRRGEWAWAGADNAADIVRSAVTT
ncbi:hypothetical protein [Streptosporangium sp. NPDC023615]|uniref:hypothetical protein n=1 Tax=Streptosporangium sp. NPDC023615 TaxID=3154794 RepID=UPI003435EAFC